jgi:hypothetical protein
MNFFTFIDLPKWGIRHSGRICVLMLNGITLTFFFKIGFGWKMKPNAKLSYYLIFFSINGSNIRSINAVTKKTNSKIFALYPYPAFAICAWVWQKRPIWRDILDFWPSIKVSKVMALGLRYAYWNKVPRSWMSWVKGWIASMELFR